MISVPLNHTLQMIEMLSFMGCRFCHNNFFNVKKIIIKGQGKTRELLSQSCVLGGKQRSQGERATGDLAGALWLIVEHARTPPLLDEVGKLRFFSCPSLEAPRALGEPHGSLRGFVPLQQNPQLSSACGSLVTGGGMRKKAGTA